MCLGIPARVLKIENKMGLVDILGVTREVSIELLKDVKIGEYVIIHAGCAIEKIDEEEAKKTIELFKELQVLEDE